MSKVREIEKAWVEAEEKANAARFAWVEADEAKDGPLYSEYVRLQETSELWYTLLRRERMWGRDE